MRSLLQSLYRPIDPGWSVLAGLAVVTGLHLVALRLEFLRAEALANRQPLAASATALSQTQERIQMANQLKRSDEERIRINFSGQALTQKSLYESGLSLQEERRLLEKQLEIMTTYLQVNPALQRVFLFRGGQPLESFLLSYIPMKEFAGVAPMTASAVRIVSKERFASPERGQSQMVGGQLVWTPPQVGSSVRSNALGEFVIFTNSKLTLHGPPVNPDDHEKFPHICLGLSREAARQLYRDSFIGTRILMTPPVASDQ